MQKSEQIRVLKELMAHLDEDTNVDAGGMRRNPTDVYVSPDLARKEWDHFFRNYPQIIGLSADLPDPGSFVTLSDFGIPVLAVRDQAGGFRAFLNACRHRGTILENDPRGMRSRFSCPFHSWTYSNKGDLVSVPKEHHFGKFDKDCHGLIPLPAVERCGFLWVHPNPEGEIDAEALLGGLAPEFESWNFGRFARVGEDTYDMELNWKLAMDTFGETYHFTTLHRNSLARTFYGNAQAYDVFGRNHRMTMCLKGIDTLRGQPEEAWDITVGAFPVYYLFPNVQVNMGDKGVILLRVYPDPEKPGRSISRVTFYALKELVEAHGDQVLAGFKNFADVIRDEDYVAASSCQKSAEAGLQDHVLFGRNEPALHHYHNTYREALGMEPLELIKQ